MAGGGSICEPSSSTTSRTASARALGGLHAKLDPQVDDRHHLVAHVDDAMHIIGRLWKFGRRHPFENFTDLADLQRKDFLSQVEGQVLT
jgi:hypothetical protein